jgi:hypothetical protein
MTIRSPWAMTRGAVAAVCLLLSAAAICSAGTVSYTGTFITPEDEFIGTLTVAAGGSVTLQTFGFGGGINSVSDTITPGGFDPLVALYQGTGPSALFLDGTADNLSNYSGEPPACPPAGLVTIGSVAGQCGDVRLNFNGLDAGTYTFLLTDVNYVPNAIYETGGLLGDGFSDLTGGSLPFATCYDVNDCNTDTANWALDVTTSGSVGAQTPEPSSFVLVGFGLLTSLAIQLKNKKDN